MAVVFTSSTPLPQVIPATTSQVVTSSVIPVQSLSKPLTELYH